MQLVEINLFADNRPIALNKAYNRTSSVKHRSAICGGRARVAFAMDTAKGVFTLSDDGGATDDGNDVTGNCLKGDDAINGVSEDIHVDNDDDVRDSGSRGNDADGANIHADSRHNKYRQHRSGSRIRATHFQHHIVFFIIFGLCCAIKGNWAGFACLSNPCIFGVCIDDLNRFVIK